MPQIHMNNAQIVEFGLGKLGIFITKLISESTNIEEYCGIAIERYAEEHPINSYVPSDNTIQKEAEDVMLIFHTEEAILSLKETLDTLLNTYFKR